MDKIYVVQERRVTVFKSPNLRKGSSGICMQLPIACTPVWLHPNILIDDSTAQIRISTFFVALKFRITPVGLNSENASVYEDNWISI